MFERILGAFVPNYTQCSDPAVRERCGLLSGSVGVALNLLLFAVKLLAGILTSAISVTADAFNNLSDAGSSIVTLAGFRLASRKADAGHPFGHGRVEYLAGLLVSLLILLVGVELGRSSLEKIFHPQTARFTPLAAAILAFSIGVKLWLAWFNSALSRHINSDALAASAVDSRSDALATSVVLAGLTISRFTSLQLDGYLGVLVAVFIFKSGLDAARDTLNPLLGKPPEPEMVADIERLILSHPPVRGIHDLVIHDYGPGRRMMSVHAEVPADSEFLAIHDVVDHIERELRDRFRLEAVIHMDPVQIGDPQLDRLRTQVEEMAARIDPALSVHDFQVTAARDHTDLIFDVVVPYGLSLSDEYVRQRLNEEVQALPGSYHAVIDIDHSCVL